MPIDYKKYPTEWKRIRRDILARAGNRCEQCGVPNNARGYRDAAGRFISEEEVDRTVHGDTMDYPPMRPVRIVLTIAHLHDPNPHNCDDANLAALCQQCHNRLDAPMRARNAARNRRLRGGQQELPL